MSNPKTKMSCDVRKMSWVKANGKRDGFCRKKSAKRHVNVETCEKRGKKWIKSVSDKNGKMRKAYCRSLPKHK